jgi:hypothetical protein
VGVHILEGKDGNALFYCSTTGWGFGPLMGSADEAELFLKFLDPVDPRVMKDPELEGKYSEFVHAYVCECGELRDEYDAEKKADAMFGQCICPDEEAGDCDWCKAKSAAENWTPENGERFTCVSCQKKAKKTHVSK